MYHLGKAFSRQRELTCTQGLWESKGICGSGITQKLARQERALANYRLHSLGFQQREDCFTVMNLIPEVLIVPSPLASWAIAHASQTQQIPNQIQSGSSLSLFFSGSIILAKIWVPTHLAASPTFPLDEVPVTLPLPSPNSVLPSLFPQSLLLCPGLVFFYPG